MLKRSINAEFLKLKHSFIWIILIILPIFSVIIGDANYYLNREILQNQWLSLWTQVGLFYVQFFFPILISICCSYQCRLEHKNHNWNRVMCSPIPVSHVFLSKLIVLGSLTFIVQLLLLLLFFISGKFFGFNNAFPIEIIGWCFRGWISSITIGTIGLYLSMRIKSFSIPIGIIFCSCFVGLAFYVQKLGMFFPTSLLIIGMSSISQSSLTLSELILFLIMNILMTSIFCIISVNRLNKIDVSA